MKKLICYLILLCTVGSTLFAQSPNVGIVKGKLLDVNKEAIPYASVSLLNMDESLVQGAITNDKGMFELDAISYGDFILDINYLGFKNIRQQISLSKESKKINLGTLTLEEDQAQLNEVTVTAEKSQYNLRLDKKVFNVGKDVLSGGGSAIDVLAQVPLVTVSPDGAVALRGSNQVQILINGKRSGLTMNNAMDQIPAENIDRIEVMTNPSARYDASGSAGIINIILKKDKGMGFNGQISVNVGAPADHMVIPTLNYKSEKVNIFSNFRWRYSDYNGQYSTKQEQISNGQSSFLNRKETQSRHDDGLSGYLGADFYLNDKNTLTLAFLRYQTKDTDETELLYDITNFGEATSEIVRNGNSLQNRNYNQLEANYTRTFDKKGQKFTTDFQYDFWNSEQDWDMTTEGLQLDERIRNPLQTNSKAASRDFVLQSDYVQPLSEKSGFELGAKLENRTISNDYLAQVLDNDIWKVFEDIDNSIDYSEKIAAAYLQYKSNYKKLEYMIGLRSEYTQLDIEDDENEFTNDNSYLNFFPSVNVSLAMSDKNSFQLSYSKRINRPNLWSLYPFSTIIDFNLQEIGNPNLQAAYADALELTFLSIHDKVTINPGIYYRHTVDPFSNFLFQNDQETFITKPINIDRRDEIGGELSISYQPIKMLRLNAEVSFFHFDEKGNYEGQNLDASGTTWFTRANANLNLQKGFRLQAMFDYRAPRQDAQTKQLANYTLSFGVQKSFFKDKVNVGVRAFNILDTRKYQTITESENFRIEESSRRYGARYSMQITYRFNQSDRDRVRQARRGNR